MRILIFGDSIVQGSHDDVCGGWCNRLVQFTQEKTVASGYEYDSSIFNLGISGNNTEDLLKRLPAELDARLTGREGAVVIAIGINDSQYEVASGENRAPVEDFEQNVSSCIEKAKEYTEHIFVLGLLPIDETKLMPMPWKPTHGYTEELARKYNERLAKVADEQGCAFVEMDDLFDGDLDAFLPDGLHPNAEGHRLIFERVKEVLEQEGLI